MSIRLTQRTLAKTASYTILPWIDSPGTRFSNRGATGTITLTLPAPIAALLGVYYEFEQHADYTLTVAGAAAGDICTLGNAAADNVSFAVASNKVGRRIVAKCDGTQWHCAGIGGGGFCVNGTQVTSATAEGAFLQGVTAGTAAASKAVVLDATLDIATIHKITFSQEAEHAYQRRVTLSVDTTLSATHIGAVIDVDTDAKVLTLPATVVGHIYRIRNAGADGAVLVTVSPNASDKIIGGGFTAADNKDALNTKATAKKGDEIWLLGDGVDGWYVMGMRGTWVRET